MKNVTSCSNAFQAHNEIGNLQHSLHGIIEQIDIVLGNGTPQIQPYTCPVEESLGRPRFEYTVCHFDISNG